MKRITSFLLILCTIAFAGCASPIPSAEVGTPSRDPLVLRGSIKLPSGDRVFFLSSAGSKIGGMKLGDEIHGYRFDEYDESKEAILATHLASNQKFWITKRK